MVQFGLAHRPVKPEVAGSIPVGPAISNEFPPDLIRSGFFMARATLLIIFHLLINRPILDRTGQYWTGLC